MYFLRAMSPSTILWDFRMHQRFAAGNGDDRCAALIHGFHAIVDREMLFEDVRRMPGSCRSRRKPDYNGREAPASSPADSASGPSSVA